MTERLNSELEGERANSRDLEEKLRMLEEVRVTTVRARRLAGREEVSGCCILSVTGRLSTCVLYPHC